MSTHNNSNISDDNKDMLNRKIEKIKKENTYEMQYVGTTREIKKELKFLFVVYKDKDLISTSDFEHYIKEYANKYPDLLFDENGQIKISVQRYLGEKRRKIVEQILKINHVPTAQELSKNS